VDLSVHAQRRGELPGKRYIHSLGRVAKITYHDSVRQSEEYMVHKTIGIRKPERSP